MKRKNKNELPIISSLCFGVYARLLLNSMAESYREQIAVTELLLTHIIEKKNLQDRLGNTMVVTDKMASELFSFKTEVRQTIKKAASSKLIISQSKKYFKEYVIPCIAENLIEDLLYNLKNVISNDTNIADTMKNNFLQNANKDTLDNFLSSVFLYAVQKQNKHYDSEIINNSNKLCSKKDIWEACKREYLISRSEGNRFANLNILSKLLPNGYITQNSFTEYGKTEKGATVSLNDILIQYNENNLSFIGEGGIGKTTFLIKLMERVFEEKYQSKSCVPIFIELNRCPPRMGEWYSDINQRTNFIIRYISAQIKSCEMEDVESELLSCIEAEFKKKPESTPEYMLLLDGFNEVIRSLAVSKVGESLGSTVRELLNREIQDIMDFPNVRVIITSRKMDMVYFSNELTKNIELTGVKKEDIKKHLYENHYREAEINAITADFKLLECLRIPLFLCMFTAGWVKGNERPTTRGEILYNFFNRTQGLYTERMNARRINTLSSLSMIQTWFILDFVIPYIGWTFEYIDHFSYDKPDLIELIESFFNNAEEEDITFWNKKVISFPEYETASRSLRTIKDSLISQEGEIMSGEILECIESSLGVMYRDKDFNYYFIHHHVRDYFAGVYDVQLMRMSVAYQNKHLAKGEISLSDDAFAALHLMNGNPWSETKRVYIGEMLSEHKNAPIIKDGRWQLPIATSPEQDILRSVLDIFRNTKRAIIFGVLNIVETLKNVRGNLAGESFSKLNLKDCRLHGVTCSVGFGDNILYANFNGSEISDDTFQIEGHLEEILEFAYSKLGDYLFTMSTENTVKRWDVDTGRCMNTITLPNSKLYESESLTQSRLAISHDDNSFLVGGFKKNDETNGHSCFVQEYDWIHGWTEYIPAENNTDINVMNFSPDDKYVIIVYSNRHMYVYPRKEIEPVYDIQFTEIGNVIEVKMINNCEFLWFYTIGTTFCEESSEDIKEVTYEIAIYNAKNNKKYLLHSYSIEFDFDGDDDVGTVLSPPFCVDQKCETIVFWEGNSLRKLTLSSKHVTDMAYNYDAPDYLVFAKGVDMLLLLHFDACVKYDIVKEYVEAIYQYEDLTFQIAGSHNAIKLLMFDERLNPFEWDLVASNKPVEKYRYSTRSITNVFTIEAEKRLIVTFDNDCLIVLDEQGKLVESMCYGERESQASIALYSDTHGYMLFHYENEDYEYVKRYHFATGESVYAYFDYVEGNKIKSMFMPATEDRMFCEFVKKVTEIDLNKLTSTLVFQADESETIQAAFYSDVDNSLKVLVSFSPDSKNSIAPLPRMYEFKNVADGKYKLNTWYELPFLDKFLLQKLSPFHKETFPPLYRIDDGTNAEEYYCINSGMFLNVEADDEKLMEAMCIQRHGADGVTEPMYFDPYMVNYVISDLPALVHHLQGCEEPLFQLLNINDALNTIVTLHHNELVVFKYSKNGVLECCRIQLSKNNEYDTIANAVITGGNVYYWKHPNFLFSLDIETGKLKSYENFVPGFIVSGCDFRGAKMSDTVRNILKFYGCVI